MLSASLCAASKARVIATRPRVARSEAEAAAERRLRYGDESVLAAHAEAVAEVTLAKARPRGQGCRSQGAIKVGRPVEQRNAQCVLLRLASVYQS